MIFKLTFYSMVVVGGLLPFSMVRPTVNCRSWWYYYLYHPQWSEQSWGFQGSRSRPRWCCPPAHPLLHPSPALFHYRIYLMNKGGRSTIKLCNSQIQCCESGIFIPDPGSASKNLSILTPKMVLSSRKYDPVCSSRIQILDPEHWANPHIWEFTKWVRFAKMR